MFPGLINHNDNPTGHHFSVLGVDTVTVLAQDNNSISISIIELKREREREGEEREIG